MHGWFRRAPETKSAEEMIFLYGFLPQGAADNDSGFNGPHPSRPSQRVFVDLMQCASPNKLSETAWLLATVRPNRAHVTHPFGD